MFDHEEPIEYEITLGKDLARRKAESDASVRREAESMRRERVADMACVFLFVLVLGSFIGHALYTLNTTGPCVLYVCL